MDRNALISCFRDTLNFSTNLLQNKTARAQQSNKVYRENFRSSAAREGKMADIVVTEGTSFAIARQFVSMGRIAVLNFANPHYPGGGVANGAMAQEECLCRSSNLYPCLAAENVAADYYAYNRSIDHHFFSDRLIYTRDVTVFKTDDTVPQMMPEQEWFDVDVITCAAPYLGQRKHTNLAALLDLFKRRIRNIFEAAIDNGVDVLVLGAFGCGAFKNPPNVVARAFREVIRENALQFAFRKVVFAIKSTTDNAPWNACSNLVAFELEFYGISSELCKERMAGGTPVAYAHGDAVMPGGRVHKAGPEFLRYYNWKTKNPYFGKQFSVLGDSISTLDGYNPRNYNVFYEGETCGRTGVSQMKDTWWGKVIDFFGGELLVNNSWSGSRVTMMPGGSAEQLFPAAVSDQRTGGLHIGNVMPDVILVYLGTNDWANGVTVENITDDRTADAHYQSFTGAYRDMLVKLQRNYPKSEIWCCELGRTYISDNSTFQFPTCCQGVEIDTYNRAIWNTAMTQRCDTIAMTVPYDSVDGIHPNATGMDEIAMMVIRCRAPEAAEQFLECQDDNHEFVMTGQEGHSDYFARRKYYYACRRCGKKTWDYLWKPLFRRSSVNEAEPDRCKHSVSDPTQNDTIGLYLRHAACTVRIQKSQLVIGSKTDCDLQLEGSWIAESHAKIFCSNGKWFIQDNYTKHGTYLNGVKLQPGVHYSLTENCEIGFGRKAVEMVFCRTE